MVEKCKNKLIFFLRHRPDNLANFKGSFLFLWFLINLFGRMDWILGRIFQCWVKLNSIITFIWIQVKLSFVTWYLLQRFFPFLRLFYSKICSLGQTLFCRSLILTIFINPIQKLCEFQIIGTYYFFLCLLEIFISIWWVEVF